MHREKGYTIEECCAILHVTRSAYYKLASGKASPRERGNRELAEKVEQIHTEHPEMGYRRIKADDPSPFPALTQIEVYGRDLEIQDEAH